METTPPFPIVSSQRQLSVIMFTDAVGFSARMQEQEIATLNRLERDTAVMRRMIENHAGTVLKSTGDGLLIQFVSAVQAVACALEIQHHLAAQAADPAYAKSLLRYRVGIHLGDVFVGNGDVMGDGVNIAARLVGQAIPGGIVISQMVYDVVKNKLPLHVQRLGPQPLKNIKEPVVIYRVLLEAPQAAVPVAPAVAAAAASVVPPPKAGSNRSYKLLLALGLVLVVALTARYLLRQYSAHEEELQRSQAAHAKFGAEAGKISLDATAASPDPDPRPQGRDFTPFVTRNPAINDISADTAALRLEADQSVKTLISWLTANLKRYTKDRPLPLRTLGDRTILFVGDANLQLHFGEGGASRRAMWAELKPPIQGAIIVSVLRDMHPVPPEVRQGAVAFAYLYGQPEMLAALPR
jgi:class 3 adenylate cyclase